MAPFAFHSTLWCTLAFLPELVPPNGPSILMPYLGTSWIQL
jgi:hypothetical protein